MIDTRTSLRTPAHRPASCRLRVELVKNSVAACWSGDGPVATSMIVWTPVRAWSSPSPVITSTPCEREMGTTSYPRDSRMSTTGRPTRPVAPATAILVLRCISVSLEWIAPHSGDTPWRGDVTDERLTAEFEEQRLHLRAVAYRMLGSLSEADDAVQEAWLRLSRIDADEVENLGGWLTTVVARVSLNMLRSRRSRREESLDVRMPEPIVDRADLDTQREVLDAFLAAARKGDFEALLEVLDPDVVLRADRRGVSIGAPRIVRGAANVARGALAFSRLDIEVRPALVNGAVGTVTFRDGRPFAIAGFTIRNRRIVEMDIIADAERLNRLDLEVLD